MGMVCVVHWVDANGIKSLAQLQDELLNNYKADLLGRWSGSFKLYRDSSNVSASRKNSQHLIDLNLPKLNFQQQTLLAEVKRHPNTAIHYMSLSNIEGKGFSWSKETLVESGSNLELVLAKLSNIWTQRQVCTLEGSSFNVGDYSVRVGNLSIGSVSKGLIIEVEYKPSNSPLYIYKMSHEFLMRIIPRENENPPKLSYSPMINWNELKLSSKNFSPIHIAHQYKNIIEQDKIF